MGIEYQETRFINEEEKIIIEMEPESKKQTLKS